ncbi:MAG TPA: ATP-grasp domain-containing protein [Aliidongia sp.]|nr:ATP-grasp domain-containing protein [Aliidongia sp.]
MTTKSRRPVALIATACRWVSTVRLAKALSSVGFDVGFLGPADHPIDAASIDCSRAVLSGLWPSRSLKTAIEAVKPDIVIPADEMILLLLHQLHRSSPGLRDLIERSLGAPENYAKTLSRVALAEIAREEGVAIPSTLRLTSERDPAQMGSRLELPAYVKVDASWGGAGVIRVDTVEDCARAYRRLRSFLGIPRTVWRLAAHGDATRLPLRRARLDISVQSGVDGAPANCAVTAWRGEMLACIEAVALQTRGPTGSSTVIRILRDQPMHETCRRLVKRLGLSGLIGFDFIIEKATGRAVLIELNPRATQTCHLRLGKGADPPEALRAAVTGEPEQDAVPMCESDIIELFPQERLGNTDTAQATDRVRPIELPATNR